MNLELLSAAVHLHTTRGSRVPKAGVSATESQPHPAAADDVTTPNLEKSVDLNRFSEPLSLILLVNR